MIVHIRVLKMLNNIVILFPLKIKLLKTHFLKWFKENIVQKKKKLFSIQIVIVPVGVYF